MFKGELFMTENELIKKFIEKRKEKGLSQKAIAEKLNTKQQNISRIEKGLISPTLKSFISMLECIDEELTIKEK